MNGMTRQRAGPVAAGRCSAPGSDTRSPDRSAARCGPDEGGPLRRPRHSGPRRHPSVVRLRVHEYPA